MFKIISKIEKITQVERVSSESTSMVTLSDHNDICTFKHTPLQLSDV